MISSTELFAIGVGVGDGEEDGLAEGDGVALGLMVGEAETAFTVRDAVADAPP